MFGDFPVRETPDSVTGVIEKSDPLLRAWQGVVPAISLFPVPGRAMATASLFARASHPLNTVKKLTQPLKPGILQIKRTADRACG